MKTMSTGNDRRLNIKAKVLWDVPLVRAAENIEEEYKYHENSKKLKYESRLTEVENAILVQLERRHLHVMKKIAARLSERNSIL